MRSRVDDIITLAARVWGVTRDDLIGTARFNRFVKPRQAVFLVAREHGHSLPFIGQRCGGRDHTSVMYGVRKADDNIARDPDYAAKVEELRKLASGSHAFVYEREQAEAVRRAALGIEDKPEQPKTTTIKKPRNVFENDGEGFAAHETAEQKLRRTNSMFVERLLAELEAV